MSDFDYNPFTGRLDRVLSTDEVLAIVGTNLSWKEPVAELASLPLSGNTNGDVRATLDTDFLYIWSNTSSSGVVADWVQIGSTSGATWGTITGDILTQLDLQAQFDTKADDPAIFSIPTEIKVVMPVDGLEGSTTIEDLTSNHSPVANGSGTIVNTPVAKFGNGSFSALTNTDFISLADSSDWNIFDSTGTYTVSFWVYPTDLSGTLGLFSQFEDASNYYELSYSGGSMILESNNGSNAYAQTLNLNQWNHICVYKTNVSGIGNRVMVYVNGNFQSSGTGVITTQDLAGALRFGIDKDNNSAKAYFDDIVVGHSNFLNIPASPFTNITVPTTALFQNLGNIVIVDSNGDIVDSDVAITDIADLQEDTHIQNTDTGTTSQSFAIDTENESPRIKCTSGYSDDLTPDPIPVGDSIFGSPPLSGSFPVDRAWDNTTATAPYVVTGSGLTTGYIFATPRIITRYDITTSISTDSNFRNWTFQGSNDTTTGFDGTWTTLDTVVDGTASGNPGVTPFIYEISNTTAYSAYRLVVSSNWGHTDTQVEEIELRETLFEISARNKDDNAYVDVRAENFIVEDSLKNTDNTKSITIDKLIDLKKSSVQFRIVTDTPGSAISTGIAGWVEMPFTGTITEGRLLADQVGSIQVDVWKDTYANYPPTDADSITAAAPLTISSSDKSEDIVLNGWTLDFTEGDIIYFNVDSATDVEDVLVALRIERA